MGRLADLLDSRAQFVAKHWRQFGGAAAAEAVILHLLQARGLAEDPTLCWADLDWVVNEHEVEIRARKSRGQDCHTIHDAVGDDAFPEALVVFYKRIVDRMEAP